MIKNLNEFIDPFGKQHCFIHIDNFQGINVPELEYPVVLRRLLPMAFTWGDSGGVRQFKLAWIFLHYQRYILHPCLNYSTFLTSKITEYEAETCTRISFNKFSAATKPWNCQTNFGVYPYTLMNNAHLLKYPKVFDYTSEFLDYLIPTNLPSRFVPTVHVIIPQANVVALDILDVWINQILSHPKAAIPHELFVVIKETYGNRWRDGLLGSFANLTDLSVVGICHKCPANVTRYYDFETLVKFPIKTTNLSSIRRMLGFLNDVIPKHVYLKVDGWHMDKKLSAILQYYGSCKFGSGPNPMKLIIQDAFLNKVENPTDHTSEAFAYFWTTIMKNYSFEIPGDSPLVCFNGKRLKKTDENVGQFHAILDIYRYPPNITVRPAAAILDATNSMQFVSCGNPEFENLAFSELFRVFHWHVWVSLAVSVAGFLTMLSIMTKHKCSGLVEYSMGVIKILLEQGDPFRENILQNEKNKITVGLLLLAGIVISGAYKNTNVYNMIIPQQAIPYEKLEELVQHNFIIYTQLSWVGYKPPPDNITIPKLKTTQYAHYISEESDWAILQSEILYRWESQLQLKQFFEEINRLLQATKLIPSLGKTLENAYREYLLLKRRGKAKQYTYLQDLVSKVEHGELFEFLKTCRSSAAVLPSFMSRLYQLKLKKLGRPFVYLGKENFYVTKIGFSMTGYVPNFLLERFRSVESSGIWEWLSKISDREFSDIEDESEFSEPLKKPSLNGNVVVIFTLFLCGCVLATTIFLAEGVYNGLKMFRKFWKIFCFILSTVDLNTLMKLRDAGSLNKESYIVCMHSK